MGNLNCMLLVMVIHGVLFITLICSFVHNLSIINFNQVFLMKQGTLTYSLFLWKLKVLRLTKNQTWIYWVYENIAKLFVAL